MQKGTARAVGKKEKMSEYKLPFTGHEKIRFNVPPFVGKEYEYIRQAVENRKICGDGEFTRKASRWFEERTGTAKCLMTTSCTHATELARRTGRLGRIPGAGPQQSHGRTDGGRSAAHRL